ncbi:phage antirepressor KilAC domain-containing protein [Yersinia mollaretii]|uniref:phage antirepressor KilAC domain-containing protein n=1 Tax=Yersinia mollaretii TaxID=33060 RepID=UPI0011A1896C|nr:phage antirepressor KilAC domain-containing protein [Yersinia mollaretii]
MHHWIYRRTGGRTWLAYQERIQQGVLEHKVTTVSRGDGSEKVVEQVLVTAKGLTKLSKMLGINGVAA